ncbi:MAG: hypothetical protein ABI599_11120 [Flavobacteriales bacterium]
MFHGTDQAAQLVLGGGSNVDVLYGGAFNPTFNTFGGATHYTLLWTSTMDVNTYPFRRGSTTTKHACGEAAAIRWTVPVTATVCVAY